MAVFKCKMCGGSLTVSRTGKTGVCDFCGTEQTLPSINDTKVTSMYNQAAELRRGNDYDQAMGLYEKVQKSNPQDAESYWSLVLCKYGIEYVEDPATRKRLPTINRTQYTSIYDDDNYLKAIKLATPEQRALYEKEAAAISEIQKGILSISKKESPFDVFISYKETDQYGRRTRDSVYAHELYNELVRHDFKVFFAPVTLQNILGNAYEPYIFAALNSAKVMVVIGTNKENFNAVWVRNEWSRYLKLIKEGKPKVLIPAYRDMDAYDLPQEFSHLQALNMTKLGFMIDLVEAIKKIVNSSKNSANNENNGGSHSSSKNIDTMLKRAYIHIGNKEWMSAKRKIDEVLDVEPENGYAHYYYLLADLHVSDPEKLASYPRKISEYNAYKNAIRYGDDELVGMLTNYAKLNAERINNNSGGFRFKMPTFSATNNANNNVKKEEPKPVINRPTTSSGKKTPYDFLIKYFDRKDPKKKKQVKYATSISFTLMAVAFNFMFVVFLVIALSTKNNSLATFLEVMLFLVYGVYLYINIYHLVMFWGLRFYLNDDVKKRSGQLAGSIVLFIFFQYGYTFFLGFRANKFWREYNNDVDLVVSKLYTLKSEYEESH